MYARHSFEVVQTSFELRFLFDYAALHCLPVYRTAKGLTLRVTRIYTRYCVCTFISEQETLNVVASDHSTAAIPGIPIIAYLAGKEGLFS